MKKTYHKTSNDRETVVGHSLSSRQLIQHYVKRFLFATRHQHQLAFLTLVFLLSLSVVTVAITGSAPSTSALTYQDNVDLQFTFNPSITISVTDLTIPSLGPGSSSDSNIATVSVSSNAIAGYTLSSTVGSTESTSSYYNYGTDLRLSSSDTTNKFTNLGNTTATTLNDIANSKWGYSYISCSDANCNTTTGNWKSGNINIANGTTDGYGGYATTATSITHISTTTPGDSAIKYKIGAKASTTQAAGTYTNVINFIGVANPVTTEYTLTYASNESGTTNLPSSTTGTTTNGTFTISSTIPTLPSSDHRSFKGWCTVDNTGHTDSCTDGTNTGSIIQPGKQYVIGATTTTFTGTVYAVWGSDGPTIADFTYMQDLANLTPAQRQSLIYNMAEEETATLKDKRDNQDYTIAKLKDGNIWMTKNMNIAGGTTLTSDTTDFTDEYFNSYTAGDSRLAKAENGLTLPASSTSGFDTDNYSYVYNSGNTTNCGASGQNTPCYSYYSWDAATLGSGRDIDTQNTDAPYSICPKGWKLPTSRYTSTFNASTAAQSDFYVLTTNYGMATGAWSQSTANFYNQAGPNTATPSFLLAGYYGSSSFSDGGSAGYYWSSTSSSSTNGARDLLFNSSLVYSAHYGYRYYGFSVRCILKNPIDDMTYMQDFANLTPESKSATIDSMPTEKTYTLKDSRDNQDYTIAKLKDGKVWMTKNLNIAGNATLSSTNTDVSSEYIDNFSTSNNLTKSDNTLILPASSTTGFDTDNYSYIYNSGNTTNCGGSGQNTPCFSYYSWDAATLGSGRSITTQNTDAPYSICPKGWRLPTSGQHDGTTPETNWKRGDFYRLLTAYGANLESAYNQNTATFWNNAGAGTVANFLLSGDYNGSTFRNGGTLGLYWSSTSTSSTVSRNLSFNTGYVGSADNYYRRDGFSIRCLLR